MPLRPATHPACRAAAIAAPAAGAARLLSPAGAALAATMAAPVRGRRAGDA
jgi:hypothetical protein